MQRSRLPAIDGHFVDEGGYRSAAAIGSFDLVLNIHDGWFPAEEVRGFLFISPVVVRAVKVHPVVTDDAVGLAVHTNLNVVPHVGSPVLGIALDARGPPVVELPCGVAGFPGADGTGALRRKDHRFTVR